MNNKKTSQDLIPILSSLFAPFDRLIGTTSLQQGMRAFQDKLFGNNTVMVQGLQGKTLEILQSKPVIVVCNHPFDTEVILLLGSLPERKTIRMIGADSQVRMGHEFAKYILKVYPYRQEKEGKDLKLSSRVARYSYRTYSGLTDEAMHTHNRSVISSAANFVNTGGMVIMFPQGPSSKIRFRPGIGHIIKQLRLQKPTYLCMVYISGSSNFDFFRPIPGVNLMLSQPVVTFHAPQLLSRRVLPQDPKQIAAALEKKYITWITSL